MKTFWDERYSDEAYAYGTEPNEYFREKLNLIPSTGQVLLPAEGEGRNAVFAASLGWQVAASDISIEGREKALKLAKNKQVTIEYTIGDFLALPVSKESFDAAALIYVHFSGDKIAELYKKVIDALKPGAYAIVEGFAKANLPLRIANPLIGGPDNEAMLLDEISLRTAFADFNILELKEELVNLNEGKYHIGQGKVMRLFAQKK